MKRKIKFRAWVVDDYEDDGNTPKTFKMVEWNENFFSDMSPVTGYGSEFPDKDDECVTLMQFTGLKDRNGVEIYEGDIVRWVVDVDEGDRVIDEPVYYGGGAFYPVCTMPGYEYEIIGNIFENPKAP